MYPGQTDERGDCLTIAMGSDAAYECADLRVTHALPTVFALNRPRTPVLVYSSQHARPMPGIRADVYRPSDKSFAPDSVVASVSVMSVQRARKVWSGTPWSTSGPVRMTLTFDASDLATQIWWADVVVTFWYGSTPLTNTGFTRMPIVNRSGSPFGAGWWLAGLEQLHFIAPEHFLWVDGDGSYRVFEPASSTVWRANNHDRPDSITYRNQGDTVWVRHLRHGAEVRFNALGQHITTVDRLGHTTKFLRDGSGRLQTIQLPPGPPGSGPVYSFAYGGAGKLASILAPPNASGEVLAKVDVSVIGGQLASISDPHLEFSSPIRWVRFAYAGGTDHRIVRRVNRKSDTTYFDYDPAGRLSQFRIGMGTGQAALTTTFCAAESYGYTTCAPLPTATDATFTRVDGPRTDVTDLTQFLITRLGAPRKVIDAVGAQTTLTYGDANWPGLVTRVQDPRGFITDATYDSRGLTQQVIQRSPYGGADATTAYVWDAAWEFVTQIQRPTGGGVEVFAYDAATGNRKWQQLGADTMRRVKFAYDAGASSPSRGLLVSIQAPPTHLGAPTPGRDSLRYDNLGNLWQSRTPRGHWTTRTRDPRGRIVTESAPVDTSQQVQLRTDVSFDPTGRVTQEVRKDMPASSSTVTVRRFLDPEGYVDSLHRYSTPDTSGVGTIKTRWSFDRAGRVIAEIAPDGKIDSSFYDPAGNTLSVRTRRGHAITMVYDAANRMTKRRLPLVHYVARSDVGIPAAAPLITENTAFPKYPNAAAGAYDIAADSALFSYDLAGNIIAADNGDARVRRGFYANGLIKAETSYVRTVAGTDFTTHRYITGYQYNLNGQRTSLQHPVQLGAVTTLHTYDPETGELSWITDPGGQQFFHSYNFRSGLKMLTLPASRREEYGYDADDNLNFLGVWNNTTQIRATGQMFDARGKVRRSTNTLGTRDTLKVNYHALGHVISDSSIAHGVTQLHTPGRYTAFESFTVDALANVRAGTVVTSNSYPNGSNSSTSPRTYKYGLGTGRQVLAVGNSLSDTTLYDFAGNAELSWQSFGQPAAALSNRASYYDAEHRLRAADHRAMPAGKNDVPFLIAFEEYRYDAFGRRVLMWSRRFCQSYDYYYQDAWRNDECNLDLLRRTIWDGNNELWEIQVPGDGSGGGMESDTAAVQLAILPGGMDPNVMFGRVAYTHGLSMDQPLSVYRMKYLDGKNGIFTHYPAFSVVHHWNAKGQPDMGYMPRGNTVCATRTASGCIQMDWPINWSLFGIGDRTPLYWHGTLPDDKRDKAGTLYRRNRSYDPATGRFTQEDPIGLAGGMNLYGFGEGDPINFGDPFGLCPRTWTLERCKKQVDSAIKQLMGSSDRECKAAGEYADKLNQQGLIQFDRNTTAFGYVKPHPTRAEANRGRSVAPVYLGPAAFEDRTGIVVQKETRNTIAHEVTHLREPSSGQPQNDQPGGRAYQVGGKCGK